MTILEGYLTFSGGILFFLWGFFNVLFYRVSVMYIEKELAKEEGGFKEIELDKGIGARTMMYNQLILFKIKKYPFVDGEAVLRIARKKDWWLAFLSFYSFLLCMIVVMSWYFLYAPASA